MSPKWPIQPSTMAMASDQIVAPKCSCLYLEPLAGVTQPRCATSDRQQMANLEQLRVNAIGCKSCKALHGGVTYLMQQRHLSAGATQLLGAQAADKCLSLKKGLSQELPNCLSASELALDLQL